MSSPESKKLPSPTKQKDDAAHTTPLATDDTSTSHTSHEVAVAGIIGAVAGSESDACAADACAAGDGGGE